MFEHAQQEKSWLCLDDFGIAYFNQDDDNHLLTALKSAYEIIVDTIERKTVD